MVGIVVENGKLNMAVACRTMPRKMLKNADYAAFIHALNVGICGSADPRRIIAEHARFHKRVVGHRANIHDRGEIHIKSHCAEFFPSDLPKSVCVCDWHWAWRRSPHQRREAARHAYSSS